MAGSSRTTSLSRVRRVVPLSVAFACFAAAACGPAEASNNSGGEAAATESDSSTRGQTTSIDLWNAGQPAFGIFVPDERPREDRMQDGQRQPPLYTAEGAAALGANELYDFLFLNLEGAYDPAAVTALTEGLERAGSQTTLLVRIPPISADGVDAARARVSEILAAGAHGIVLPHVRSVEEARTAVSFFDGADVWSPENPDGTTLAMLMLEDPDAVAQASEIADLGGYSLLACGIGSLTRAMDGDRDGAEAGNLAVLAEATRAGLPDMITANAESIEGRLAEGFLGLLMAGPQADDIIRIGHAASGRAQ